MSTVDQPKSGCGCAATEPPKKSRRLSRQNFLKAGIGALGAIAALEVGGGSLLYLQPRLTDGSFGGVIEAGPVSSFPAGSVTEFPAGRFFLVRTPDNGFLAIYSRCPHLGCAVNYNPADSCFICPCHASSFNVVGDFEKPPVPRALDLFAVTIKNELVLVNTGQLLRRNHFSPEQVIYA